MLDSKALSTSGKSSHGSLGGQRRLDEEGKEYFATLGELLLKARGRKD